ncbi:WAT1-related protein At4g30420-like [Corylus avellana]|uniref:WAT1-related protein At4g30420-like n=1 Tax=Corylus avellana TaxID=13451 RepID=UPI00286A5835|nr:WAT1-related protein At4g30420-like [Corylus avellana]
MGIADDYKPAMAMVGLQFSYAIVALTTRAALLQGMSPRVFVVYRQAIATLVIAPVAYFSRRKSSRCSLSLRSFSWIFLAALIGVAINQNIYFEGMYLVSSSMASAMGNLVPAITFVLASIIGLERIELGSLRSIAKIAGTILCVGGAVSMALLRGPKLLNAELMLPANAVFGSGVENWLLGCLLLFGSCCCWSLWLILQVPASESCPDLLSLSAWMCFLATLQSAMLTVFTEPEPEAWHIHSNLELSCCLFSGIIGSGLSFFVQAWCISQKGPLFSAMFNPLCTVVVTILAAIFLHEEIYTGSLIGAIGVIAGLYVVLWGKAKDLVEIKGEKKLQNDEAMARNVNILMDDSSEKTSCEHDLEEPLLTDKSISNGDAREECEHLDR